MILAAGGALWRANENSEIKVLLIRTPRGVWSLPKGKQCRSEAALSCALREVREETGLVCVANHELLTVTYQDRNDRKKQVRFWAMTSTVSQVDLGDVGRRSPVPQLG